MRVPPSSDHGAARPSRLVPLASVKDPLAARPTAAAAAGQGGCICTCRRSAPGRAGTAATTTTTTTTRKMAEAAPTRAAPALAAVNDAAAAPRWRRAREAATKRSVFNDTGNSYYNQGTAPGPRWRGSSRQRARNRRRPVRVWHGRPPPATGDGQRSATRPGRICRLRAGPVGTVAGFSPSCPARLQTQSLPSAGARVRVAYPSRLSESSSESHF